jgi:hypothetical protein
MLLKPDIDGRSFDPETLKCMGSAFEAACTKLGLNGKDDPLTQLVAERIIAFAQRDLNDPAALSDTVLESLSKAPCACTGASWSSKESSASFQRYERPRGWEASGPFAVCCGA